MTGVMGEILEHYGQTVTLRSRDGEKSVRAFIQPAAARDETVPGEQTPIGWIDERLWRYTGLEEVQPGDTVIWRGRSFRVRSSREYALSDEINHWWEGIVTDPQGGAGRPAGGRDSGYGGVP